MSNTPFHRGAIHEAGHAVMARKLGAELGLIAINLANPHEAAHAQVIWTEEIRTPANEIRVAAASRACLLAFGYNTSLDQGLVGDQVVIDNELSELLPDDETRKQRYLAQVDAELGLLFNRPNVRAAVVGLVETLMHEGQIDGPLAEAIIDRHLA